MTKRFRLLTLACIPLAAGAVGPKYQTPAVKTPESFEQAAGQNIAPNTSGLA